MADLLPQPISSSEKRLQALAAWGVDLSLTAWMLRLTPAERVAGILEAADGFVQRPLFERLLRPVLHPQSPRLLIGRLVEAEVDWVLVGRLAEIAQGAPLLADRAEICFSPDATNVARLLAALVPYTPRLQAGARRERSPRFFAQHAERLLVDQTPLLLETQAARLLLQSHLSGVGAYPAVKAAAVPLDLYEAPVLVLALPTLLAQRQAQGLPEDEWAVPHLEAAALLATTVPAPAVPASPQ